MKRQEEFKKSNYIFIKAGHQNTFVNLHSVIDRFLTLGLNDENQLAAVFERKDLIDILKPDSLAITREYMRIDTLRMLLKTVIL